MIHTHSKAPRNPANHCYICLGDPHQKHKASTHFMRDCSQIPQSERDHLREIFRLAAKKRTLPRDKWPERIYGYLKSGGQTFNLKLINMVEDFYDLPTTSHNANVDILKQPMSAKPTKSSSINGTTYNRRVRVYPSPALSVVIIRDGQDWLSRPINNIKIS